MLRALLSSMLRALHSASYPLFSLEPATAPRLIDSLAPSWQDDSFGVNTRQPDYSRYPLYAFSNSSVCIVGPGDGLFVPSGSPHQVTNLSPSIAISMNYIDASNIEKALAVTRLEGLVDPESKAIHSQLSAVKERRFPPGRFVCAGLRGMYACLHACTPSCLLLSVA